MVNYISQFILAARNRDPDNEGWMQMLVFVVMVVVYALAGIMRSRAEKKAIEAEKQREEELRKTHPRPTVKKPLRLRPIEKPQATEREVVAAEKAFELLRQRLYPEPEPAPALEKAVSEPKPRPPRKKREPFVEKKGPSTPVTPLRLDITETDELKRAVIYAEIIGKPLALRD